MAWTPSPCTGFACWPPPPPAILAQAFRGELVPTEAELARREGRAYEPASALLERMRAERAQAHITAKRRSARSKGSQ